LFKGFGSVILDGLTKILVNDVFQMNTFY